VEEIAIASAAAEGTVCSPAAERMRRHRERRRDGLRCLTVEIRENEIDALIRMKFLQSEMRNSRNAILDAFYNFLDQKLD
jgi:hypothetical protein